jgi:hypothetical protein
MKNMVLAIIAACALCCVPLLIPALAGISIFGVQLWGRQLSLDEVLCALAPAVLAAIAVFAVLKWLSSRSKKKACGNAACEPSGKCGCK